MGTLINDIIAKMANPLVISVFVILAASVTLLLTISKVHKRIKKNRKLWSKILFLPTNLIVFVIGSAIEEIMFRLPLVLSFDNLDTYSWSAITVLSIIFGLAHKDGNIFTKDPIKRNITAARFSTIPEIPPNVEKTFRVVITAVLGIFTGYYAVETQGILKPFLFHLLWNAVVVVVALLVLPLLGALIMLVMYALPRKEQKRV